jgi:predicted RNA methylase
MPFDKPTRNALAKMTAACRQLLTVDIRGQLQGAYGLQPDGSALPLASLGHLDEREIEIAGELREWQSHLAANEPQQSRERERAGAAAGPPGAVLRGHPLPDGRGSDPVRAATFDRMAHETAFTVLNRLAALRLCEERGHTVECVRRGMESDGFQLYETLAGGELGARGQAYRAFLERMFDELALDLGALFDRRTPQSLLFPSERCLEEVLKLLTDPALAGLWAEDETIGWIYQYFNSKEEREQMRKESAAPRNSRELAVRNQFFTPRYVVEFLTDNTLGRIWYEMRQGDTRLKDDCRFLVRRPNEVFVSSCLGGEIRNPQSEIRNRKDPRDLKVLDPACGSGHFLLYAFDLLETIYEEAWSGNEENPRNPRNPRIGSLRDDYPTLDNLKRAIPGLILRHNLHGIDIDQRACQITALALWLRAQRSYQRLGLKPADRPRITRSNIVCAEPMPGEKELLDEFVADLRPRVLGQLVRRVFERMALAGEAGSLLKIEEEIRDAVAEAKRQWLAASKPEQLELLPGARRPKIEQGVLFDLSGITDEEFWAEAEARVIEALEAYAEKAANGRAYARRLFAEDAEQGFAFIDLCRKRFDVALMNPPFGRITENAEKFIQSAFARSYYDIYACFVERLVGMLDDGGTLGCITSKTFFATSRLSSFRRWLLMDARLVRCADMGQGVLDNATVETAAYVISNTTSGERVEFYNIQKAKDRGEELYRCINDHSGTRYSVHRSTILEFPNCSFSAYWGSRSLLSIFSRLPSLDPNFGETAAGQMTGDDFRFVRARWEVPLAPQRRWHSFAKGGGFLRYYCDWPLVVDWTESALIEYRKQTVRSILISGRCDEFKEKPALAWNRVNQIGFNVRALPVGSKFSDKAPAVFPKEQPLVFLGVLCSGLMDRLCSLQNPNRMFEVRDVSCLPIPPVDAARMEQAVRQIIELKQRWVARTEPSSIFARLFDGTASDWLSLAAFVSSTRQMAADHLSLARRLQEEIDALVEVAAGLSADDRQLLQEVLGDTPRESILHEFGADLGGCDASLLVVQVVSYGVGGAFGRWDIRLATGERPMPELPDPFAPLPACSPGMLTGDDGLPAREAPPGYPLRISWDGILVDDPGENGAHPHQEDIVRRVREVLTVIWGERAEAIEQEACEMLKVKSLHEYFRKPGLFFADHLKRYSKSRRQAPIYWPLSTASGSYTLWIYYHRLTDQTLFAAADRYVGCKIEATERRLRQIEDDLVGASGRKAAELRQAFEGAKTLLDELAAFRDELLRVANLPYKPDLNDGVLITAAPLWKLFRLPKWRKDLEECWRNLEAGDYDWAHLACSIWPDRVREKCKTDRSFAIAHGLEELCSTQRPKATKARRKKKAESMQMEM